MTIEEKSKRVSDWLYMNREIANQSNLAEIIGVPQGVLSASIRLERFDRTLTKAIDFIEGRGRQNG